MTISVVHLAHSALNDGIVHICEVLQCVFDEVSNTRYSMWFRHNPWVYTRCIPVIKLEWGEPGQAANSRIQGKFHHGDLVRPVLLVQSYHGPENLGN